MARLAFFAERLPAHEPTSIAWAAWARPIQNQITDFSYGLMTSLADQQHDVRVFSTYREGDSLPSTHSRLQIIRPFRNWGWLELPRLIPILMDFQPDILHFIQPRREVFSGLTNVTTLLPTLAPLLGRSRIVVSVYDVRLKELQRNKRLLSSADVIVVANQHQASEVVRWFGEQPHRAEIEVVGLPTPADENVEARAEAESGFDRLKAVGSNILFIPGDLDEQRDLDGLAVVLNRLLLAVPDLGVVIGGGWGRVPLTKRRSFMREFEDQSHGARILLTGPLDSFSERACVAAASVIFVAGHARSSLALASWIRQSLHRSRPLVLSVEQSELDPMKWRDRENAFIVSDDTSSWTENLKEALSNETLRSEISARLPSFAQREAMDEPGNAMSRIYAQVLRAPRKPLR